MVLPNGQDNSNSRITLVSSSGTGSSSDRSEPVGQRYMNTTIDVLPSSGSNFSINGLSTGSSTWSSPAPPSASPSASPPVSPQEKLRSRKKRLAMAAGISLVIIVLAVAVVTGTYYGVVSAHPLPVNDFPGASDMAGPPSESVLAAYRLQSVAADAAACSKVGNDILLRNGSAVEAAIATSLCAGLYHPHSCGIGGGFFMVVYEKAFRNATAIDAREVAPAAATETMYVDDKEISSVKGWSAIAVPGEIYGYWRAFELFKSGNLEWADLFEPAITLARDGLRVNAVLAKSLLENAEDIRTYDEGLTEIFLNKTTGQPYVEGDLLKYPVLAETLQTIANDTQGVFEFYRGSIAQRLIKDVEDGKGIITLADLNNYRPVVDDALHSQLRDNSSVFGVPPPAGSLVLQYIIAIMDGYGYGNSNGNGGGGGGGFNTTWEGMNDDEKILFYQRFTEAMKFAYARRTEMGDDAFVPEVAQMKDTLLAPWFARLTRTLINDNQTSSDTRSYGVSVVPVIGKVGTSHISIIDKFGNAVAMTTTINTYFGSKRVSKSTGIIMNNEMDDFTTNPTMPNYYGLPPSRANRIAPGKRPQSSCAPTIITDSEGVVRVVAGGSGGSRIISAVANVLMRVLYFGQNVKEAIDAPRLHHQLLPMELNYEPGFNRKHLKGLEAKGHNVIFSNVCAVVQGVTRIENDTLEANCDYRKKGAPDGV